jgi:hypothetical protein
VKNNIFFQNAAGVPGNHGNYILFANFWNSCIPYVFSSLDDYRNSSTHGISGLVAAGV